MTTDKPNQPPPAADPPAGDEQVQVADTVLARVAAYYARTVPGVVNLQPGLSQSVAGLAGTLLGPAPQGDPRLSTDGVTIEVDPNGLAHIEIAAVTRLGHNCRDVAEAVQQQVTSQVRAHTGRTAVVTVTITDIDLNTGTEPPADPPPTGTAS